MEALNELLETERRLWSNDADFYHQTYLPDAILIFPEVGRLSRDVAVDAIREENREGRYWAEVEFRDILNFPLTPDSRLLSYRARARWNYEEGPTETYCGTLYLKKAGKWRVAFHQQSKA